MKNLSKSLTFSVGFTLVELLIAIVIIVILSTIGITSFNTANTRNELQSQAKELTSVMRKLRTESVAAYKPVTGAGTPADPSCKNPSSGTDQGTYYGNYIQLTTGGTSYISGILCFDNSGNPINGSPSTTQFTQGINSSAIPGSEIIFFSFTGDIHLLTSLPTTRVLADAALTSPISSTQTITLTNGSQSYYVYFNSAGLICTEGNTSTTCAQ